MAALQKKWVDVSVPIRSGMVHWPDNPAVNVSRMMDMDKGAVCNVSILSFGAHTGTHMDGPLHFVKGGAGLDTMPFEATIGPARVIEIKDKESVKVYELENQRLKAGERILFKTRNSKKSWKSDAFDDHFVYVSKEASQFIVDAGVQTVGIDYLSVGGYYKDGVETHQILLGAKVWIIEGINLAKIAPGKYDMICLPIKVANSDGAPARVLLRAR
ncbi:MAG: cyclase family protein [Verrucomicrobiota bacterium]|nr:cyclase family protein [Verrucomicrobiota bacterium]